RETVLGGDLQQARRARVDRAVDRVAEARHGSLELALPRDYARGKLAQVRGAAAAQRQRLLQHARDLLRGSAEAVADAEEARRDRGLDRLGRAEVREPGRDR